MQPPSRREIVLCDTLVTYYEALGNDPGAPAVIFLHGWRSEARVWFRVWEEIMKRTEMAQGSGHAFRLYALGLPGFGGSQAPRTPYTLGDYALVVEAFCEKLELQTPVLVGHSFGGRVAIKVASRGRVSLKKLVLVGSAGFRSTGLALSLKRVVGKIVKPFFVFSFMQPLRRKIYARLGADDYVATPNLTQTFVNIIGEDLEHLLPQIAVPTLLVWGGQDQKDTPVSFGERMRDALPHAKLVVLSHAGHFVFLDQPEAFTSEFVSFLS